MIVEAFILFTEADAERVRLHLPKAKVHLVRSHYSVINGVEYDVSSSFTNKDDPTGYIIQEATRLEPEGTIILYGYYLSNMIARFRITY